MKSKFHLFKVIFIICKLLFLLFHIDLQVLFFNVKCVCFYLLEINFERTVQADDCFAFRMQSGPFITIEHNIRSFLQLTQSNVERVDGPVLIRKIIKVLPAQQSSNFLICLFTLQFCQHNVHRCILIASTHRLIHVPGINLIECKNTILLDILGYCET